MQIGQQLKDTTIKQFCSKFNRKFLVERMIHEKAPSTKQDLLTAI